MLDSLFLINSQHDVFIEKHWKSVVDRSLCDYFLDEIKRVWVDSPTSLERSSENTCPIIHAPPYYTLLYICRESVYYVAVVRQEVPPLIILELLHRIADTFALYFGNAREAALKENFVVLYELLDEILDNGYPFTTEPNILQEIIRPPSLLRRLANTVTGATVTNNPLWTNLSSELPASQLSNIPWRKVGLKYTNNEIYFDLTEELDAVIDVNGKVINAEAFGYINVDCRLSGMPEIVMCFLNAHVIDDVSLHPCVRLRRWEQDRVLSFVPPDGDFRLLSYRSTGNVGIPVHVRHAFHMTGVNAGRLDISLSTGRISSPKAELTEIEIHVINMPKFVTNCVADTSQGKAMYDIQKKVLTWEVGRIDAKKLPTMKGKISFDSSGSSSSSSNDTSNYNSGASTAPTANGFTMPESKSAAFWRENFHPVILLKFRLTSATMSGLRCSRVDMFGEKYRPFKGVKYISKSGIIEHRS